MNETPVVLAAAAVAVERERVIRLLTQAGATLKFTYPLRAYLRAFEACVRNPDLDLQEALRAEPESGNET